jgi:hypothetical protein
MRIAEAIEQDVRALSGECIRNPQANPAGGAGYEGHSTL